MTGPTALGQSPYELLNQSTTRSPKPGSARTVEQARKAAEEFEAMFIGQMLQHMFSGIETNPDFGGGAGEDMWRSVLVDQYGKEISKNGGIGIADAVMRTLLQNQEV
ncbi:rod-binding protein [Caenispirillum bisanense]|uniref:rod-binding protein n=1 Tax=Caenispirillum bisanense TaxID=414052 RepID=UPI0031D2B284